MAAYGQNIRKYGNRCLQTNEQDVNIHEGRADGTMVVGQLAIPGTATEDYADAGAGAENVLGVCIGFFNSDGVYNDIPGSAIADNDRVRIALFAGPAFTWLGLLPNTIVTARGELLKAAASGRLTNVTADVTDPDEVLAIYARALEAVTAGADDATVLVAKAGVA